MVTSPLPARLLEIAVELTLKDGPEAVSLREVQRRAGVSPAAAYRHYRDRDALLHAVGRHAAAELGGAVSAAVRAAYRPTARLRAGCAAYLDFAAENPGLYRAIFLTGEAPGELFGQGLRELARAGGVAAPDAPWTGEAVWAGCHGLALLLLDSPLRELSPQQRRAARNRLLDVLLAGLAHAG